MINYAHYRALLRKNLTYQLRQNKTNFCSVCFVVSIMVILGLLVVVFATSSGGGGYVPPVPYIINNTYAARTDATYGCWIPPENTCVNLQYVLFSNADPPNDPAGALPNSTYGHSGLLGNITQRYFLSFTNEMFALSPYMQQFATPHQLDDFIIATYTRLYEVQQQIQTHDPDYWNNATYKTLSNSFPTGGINFNRLSVASKIIDYTIQVQTYDQHNRLSFSDYDTVNWDDRQMYMITFMNDAFLKLIRPHKQYSITSASLQMLYTYDYSNSDGADTLVINLMCVYFIPSCLGFLLPVLVYTLVYEKSERLIEMMKMMGMKMHTYWICSYVFGYLMYSAVAIIVAVASAIIRVPVFVAVPNPFATVLLLFLYGHTQIAFVFFISTLFNRPKAAVIVSFFIFLVLVGVGPTLFIFLWEAGPMPNWVMLIPQLTLQRGLYLLTYTTSGTYATGLVSLTEISPLVQSYLFLILDTFIYLILAWYLDFVIPKEYGVTYSPFFPITSLWVFVKNRFLRDTKGDVEAVPLVNPYEAMLDELVIDEDEDIRNERERAFSDQKFLIKILDLSKKYATRGGQESRFALERFSMALPEGECLGLLGPNGAGKTTLISLLCGLSQPTSGTAIVDRFDILTDMYNVHNILGFCPQHDILWPELTVKEHLLFYSALKNYDRNKELLHVIRLADQVGLGGPHINKRVDTLSGGMKRRLSIAIAMVGESRLVLLDEPTTGLDPESRRAVWDIIERHKEGRSFIITTHNMEEADVLCSRIAIMSLGRLKCLGAPLYLKNRYGGGYILTVNIAQGREMEVARFISRICPTHIVLSQIHESSTVEYQISNEDVDILNIFSEMKANKDDVGILEWSINQTSLEQVFMKLISEDES